jgi:EmrB/QacA subfamily drug resistance transporter
MDQATPAKGAIDREGIDPDVYLMRWWTLAVLCSSLMIIMVGNTSLNVALPVLSNALHASNSQLQWLVDGYSLVFAGLLFTAGNLGDRYGRKGILQLGLVVFGAATAYAAFAADTATQLIGARVAMGAAAAMVMPATLSIITNVFPSGERAKAVAMWAGISGAGTAFGPIVSGFLLEHFSWNAVFVTNLPLVAAALIGGYVAVPRLVAHHGTPLDLPGALLSAAGLGLLVYTLIEAPAHGWTSLGTLATGTAALALVLAFVAWELHTSNPMLDVRLFRIGAFGVSSLVLTLVFFALMGCFFSISQVLQLVYGYSPLEAALRMAPISVVMVLVAPQSARLAAAFGKRRVVATGMWLVAGGIAVMSLSDTQASYPVLLAGLLVMASGMALAMAPTTDLLMSSVPRAHAGMGSAMNDTTRELGGSLGVAVFGSLLASTYAATIAPATAGLPEQARVAADSSLAGALAVSERLGDGGETLAAAARDAFMRGFRVSLVIGAVVVAAAGLVAYRFLPDRAADEAPARELDDRDAPPPTPEPADLVDDLALEGVPA